jgi:8-oxo-dGTP diphosphatase
MDADGGSFAPSEEVDQLRWVPVDEAGGLLSYAHDRNLLRRALAEVGASPLYLIRHAKAGVRAAWERPDEERPLTRRGRKQALRLVERFRGLELGRVLSSPYVRCVQTVEPLATERGVPLEPHQALAEGVPVDEALALLGSLDERPAALCGHGREIQAMIDRMGEEGATIQGTGIAKGSVWVIDREFESIRSAHYLPAPPG